MLSAKGQELDRSKLLNFEAIIFDAHRQPRRIRFKRIQADVAYLKDEEGNVYKLPTFIELEVGLSDEEGEKVYDFHSLDKIISVLIPNQTFFVLGNDGNDVILSLTHQEKAATVVWPAIPTSFLEGRLAIYHTATESN